MTPIRWYLQRDAGGGAVCLVVERVDDRRGYRLWCTDRHHAREELPHLKALVRSIGEPEAARRTFDPVEVDGPA